MKTPDEIKKGLECLDKMQFFMGQRAGRELWTDKPKDVQEKDLESFNRDIETVRNCIQQLKRERDAAVADLTVIVKSCGESYCEYCEYNDKHYCAGRCWTRNEGFKWRGVKEG